MRRLLSWRLLPFFVLIATLLGGCGDLAGEPEIIGTLPPQAPIEALQMPDNAPNVANGAQIYQENCVRCHGLTGAGDGELVQTGEVPRMISFLDPTAVRQQPVESFYNMISNGNIVNLMPPWNESLSVQERWDVAMYVYTLHYTSEQLEQGSQLVANPSTELSLKSDNELASESSLEGDDAFAAVAYQRSQSIQNWGQSLGAKDFEVFSIEGTVIHGTEGFSVPQGQSVELRYGNAEDGIQALQARIDTNNQYQFNNIPFNPDYEYIALLVYQGRNFVSELLQGNNIQEITEQEITLYEVTEDSNVVVLREVDFIIEYLTVDGVGTGLVITQQNIYENTTDRLFHILTPSDGMSASLLVQLPIGAVILNDSSDPRFLQAPNEYAIVDLRPISPGFHTIETVYFIPYENGRIIDIPVNNRFEGDVNIVLVDPELKIISDNYEKLEDDANLGTADNPVSGEQYTANYNLNMGESIIFDIDGQVFDDSSSGLNQTIGSQQQIIPILLVIVAVSGFVVVGIMLMLRSRGNDPQREIDNLLKEIAELEALHEAGRINHDAFQQQRKALREQVAQLMSENNEE